MDLKLAGQTALVTGATKGIGRAIAEGLAEERCNLHLAARTADELDNVASEIRANHNIGVETHAIDLGTSSGVDELGQRCRDVDILINNAGAIPSGTLIDIDEKNWRSVFELKFFGYINLTRHIYAAMKEQGRGVILNVIGLAARHPTPGYIAGATANAGLDNFTVALGKESPAYGVRVLGLHPGPTLTERLEDLHRASAEEKFGDADRWRDILPPQPFGRPAESHEVADLAVFLVSPRSGYASGVVHSFTGGT